MTLPQSYKLDRAGVKKYTGHLPGKRQEVHVVLRGENAGRLFAVDIDTGETVDLPPEFTMPQEALNALLQYMQSLPMLKIDKGAGTRKDNETSNPK